MDAHGKVARLVEILDRLEAGTLLDELHDELRLVLEATQQYGKPGEVTLKIRVGAPKPLKDGSAKQEFSTDVTAKAPKAPRERVTLFVGGDGWPTHHHPKQQDMPLREATVRPLPVRDETRGQH